MHYKQRKLGQRQSKVCGLSEHNITHFLYYIIYRIYTLGHIIVSIVSI